MRNTAAKERKAVQYDRACRGNGYACCYITLVCLSEMTSIPSKELFRTGESAIAMHYGTKPGYFDTSKIHFLTSKGVKEVSKVSKRAKRAVRSKRTSEQCERMSERTSEWPSTYVSILVCSRPQCSVPLLRRSVFPRLIKMAIT